MSGLRVTGILLASGLSRRMEGRDKLLLPFRGRTLLAAAVDLLADLPLHRRILVTTPDRLEAALPGNVAAVLNHRPEEGQSRSVRLGVEAASGDAYLFLTADQPLLDRQTVEALLEKADRDHIVYPVLEGKPRNPCLFPARFREELLALKGDTGGRAVRNAHPEICVPVEMGNPLPFRDIDTWEDYQELLKYNF